MSAILNSIIPIFVVIVLGSILKRLRMIDDTFISVSDKLIYFIFFPALLFWKIGKPASVSGFSWNLLAAVFCAVFLVFLLSLAFAKIMNVSRYEVGSFSQSCYRFSSYIGIAVILGAAGEDGIRIFGILIGFVIPFINVLAVSSLIWYSGESLPWNKNVIIVLKAMVSNPLILACGLGILYSNLHVPFPAFVDSTLAMMSFLALPLALISIGGSLSLIKLRENLIYSSAAAFFKLVVLPVIGYYFLNFFAVSGSSFIVAMVYFALPTSPANYILSAQLNSDVDLATSAIVLSTILSLGSLSATLFIFCT